LRMCAGLAMYDALCRKWGDAGLSPGSSTRVLTDAWAAVCRCR
jgi:hypothetical protein